MSGHIDISYRINTVSIATRNQDSPLQHNEWLLFYALSFTILTQNFILKSQCKIYSVTIY